LGANGGYGYIGDPNATFASYGSATTKIGGRDVEFALRYAAQTREDHRLFVDAFRGGRIKGVESTASP
jgi:hypothetical protein